MKGSKTLRRLLGLLARSNSGSPSPSPSQSLAAPPSVPTGPHSANSGRPVIQTIGPPSRPSVVWTKTLEIAEKKLSENNLPQLELMNLTSQSAEENIGIIIKGLHTLQEDDTKRQWSYTWRGKKVIVVERLGKILKCVEQYTKVVDIAVSSNPQVSALVWAGVWAILWVRM